MRKSAEVNAQSKKTMENMLSLRDHDEPTFRMARRTRDQHRQVLGSLRSTRITPPAGRRVRSSRTSAGSPSSSSSSIDRTLVFALGRFRRGGFGRKFATGSPGKCIMAFIALMPSRWRWKFHTIA